MTVKETLIAINAPEALAILAMEKFGKVQLELRKKNIKANKKQFYAFLVKQGLAQFNIEDFKTYLEKLPA